MDDLDNILKDFFEDFEESQINLKLLIEYTPSKYIYESKDLDIGEIKKSTNAIIHDLKPKEKNQNNLF